jgi:hypothetical protein
MANVPILTTDALNRIVEILNVTSRVLFRFKIIVQYWDDSFRLFSSSIHERARSSLAQERWNLLDSKTSTQNTFVCLSFRCTMLFPLGLNSACCSPGFTVTRSHDHADSVCTRMYTAQPKCQADHNVNWIRPDKEGTRRAKKLGRRCATCRCDIAKHDNSKHLMAVYC